MKELVAQRVYALTLGYQDLNDHERDGEDTGARPGRLLRGFQSGPRGRALSPNRLAPGELPA